LQGFAYWSLMQTIAQCEARISTYNVERTLEDVGDIDIGDEIVIADFETSAIQRHQEAVEKWAGAVDIMVSETMAALDGLRLKLADAIRDGVRTLRSCGVEWEEASSGPPLCGDLENVEAELEESRRKIAGLFQDMVVAAGAQLPHVGAQLPSARSTAPCLSDDELARTLFLEFEHDCIEASEWVRTRAAAIRRTPPSHLVDLDMQELSEYDIILNEMLARPTVGSEYMALVRDLELVCQELGEDVCHVLGLPISWMEVKRAFITKAITCEREFSLFDVVDELRASKP
jgi:hypothetical protein